MKFKRILSMLLAAIMLSTVLIAAFPTLSFAANSSASTSIVSAPNMYAKEEGDFEELMGQIAYGSAAEMLETELRAGQLISVESSDGCYSIFVNAYTGFMYYKNNITGQVLMSNSYNYSNTDSVTPELLSQIKITYSEITNSNTSKEFNSYTDAALYNQIYVSKIQNGIRVNYTLGDTKLRYLVPGALSQESYLENILLPIVLIFTNNVNEYLETNWATVFENKYGKYLEYASEATIPLDYSDPYKNRDTFSSYLDYYTYQLQYADPGTKEIEVPFYDMSDLFVFASIVMQKRPSDLNYPERSEFVTGGYKDEFKKRFRTFEELLELEKTVYYCKEHSYRANRATEECPYCEDLIEPSTVAELLFYDGAGRLNTAAIEAYVKFVKDLASEYASEKSAEIGDNSGERELIRYTPDESFYNGILNLSSKYKIADDGNYVNCRLLATAYYELGQVERLIEKYCVYPEQGEATYSFNQLYKDEKTYGYKHPHVQRAVFRCALEYTFNSDGSLSVSLPANSISFDESVYILRSITPLRYFGAGSLSFTDEQGNKDGYFFYPDGCGTVISFNDFSTSIDFRAPVYGIDHAYSDIVTITGDYREQITMPVYGAVFTEDSGMMAGCVDGAPATLNNGFFAIIEEGAPLAELSFSIDPVSKYASIYPLYKPYPSDTYDLSQTLSVSNLSKYTMVSATKFDGSYTTRIVMLSDERLVDAYASDPAAPVLKEASYVGMAEVYREYLENSGVINAIANIGNDLPLYIEAFGSMEITKKILSFPVEVSEALTTFEDVRTMYDELANAKAKILEKAREYEALAAAEEKDIDLKALYAEKAADYHALSESIDNITNINFRLTGFANGGMKSTYPAKVKWDRAVGGKKGFKKLLEYADTVSAAAGSNLGIYPEFDFLYITNTAMFDGIYPNGVSAKLIDNRYAEKQLYNSVAHMYEASMVKLVSADSLEKLYEKFNKNYSKYFKDENGNVSGKISVSTLGSDINSNFDDDQPVNRDESRRYISALLSDMKKDGYDIMVNKGNSYTYQYASHIIDAYVDSSHLRRSSYTVPFFGMVLHSYVSYAGSALNYSGDPQYDILRSIENGASLYYILCYRNTSHMKDDEELNKYYGVDYATWFEKIVEQYTMINDAIGGLQDYKIVSHRILTAERVINSSERELVYTSLVDELIAEVEKQIDGAVGAAYDQMKEDALAGESEYGRGVEVTIDKASVVNKAVELFNLDNAKLIPSEEAVKIKNTIEDRLQALEDAFNAENKVDGSDNVSVEFEIDEDFAYISEYDYITDSLATAGDEYDTTEYTVNNYNVVMVTYQKGDHSVSFILNYNIYSVIVNLGDGRTIVLDKYDYEPIS